MLKEESNKMDNVYGRFLKVATQARLDPAVIVQHKESVETWTYGTLIEEATSVSTWLELAGIQPGERCAILSENQPRWCVAYLGILQNGSAVVPLDIQQGSGSLARFIRDSEAKVLFTSHKELKKAQEATQGTLLKIVLLDGAASKPDVIPFPSGAVDREASARYESGPNDEALLLYTSGTTTDPKGVVLTHGNLLSVLDGLIDAIPVSRNDRGLAILPLFHILAQLTTLLVPLSMGGLVIMVNDLNATEVMRALQQRGITVFCCVPQFFYLIHQRLMTNLSSRNWFSRLLFRFFLILNGTLRRRLRINLGRTLFSKIHQLLGAEMRFLITGGSRFDPKIARDFNDLGFVILQGYGLTECAGNATLTGIEDRTFGSVGRPVGKTEIKIVPANSGANEEGEIAIRGPNVMPGYHHRADLTAEAIRDGWLLTGDLGRLDSSNRLYITGRKKEVIVLSSGKNIYPEELEEHYQRSPYVKEICIIPRLGQSGSAPSERLHGVIVPNMELMRQERIADVQEKIRYEIDNLSALLPSYQRVVNFHLSLADLPRTTTRKLKRREVMQLAIQPPTKEAKLWSEEELKWRDGANVRNALALIREYAAQSEIHPTDRLDLDLDQDSLGRVELLVKLQEAFNTKIPDELAAGIHTVRELVDAVLDSTNVARKEATGSTKAAQPWGRLLTSDQAKEVFHNYLHARTLLFSFLFFVSCRCFFLAAKLLLPMTVRGIENLTEEPLLLCPNHQTYFDGLLVACVLPWRLFRNLFFVGSPQYFPHPLLRWLAREAHIVLLDTESSVMEAMQVCASGLRLGKSFLIFPEGERTIDGDIGEFRKGAAILSSHTGVPMIPIGINGAFEIWPRGKGLQRLNHVRLNFGPPIPAAIVPDSTVEADNIYQSQTNRLVDHVRRLLGD